MRTQFAAKTTCMAQQPSEQMGRCTHAASRSAESMRPRHTQHSRSECAFRIKTVTP